MRHLFWGGVHPAGRKELSRGAAPTPAPLPSQVVIPMVQHIGKPCTPLVKAGEPVKLGQKIGDAEGLSATIHASVSGTVAAVEPRPHPSGRAVLSVVIDNDYQDTPAQALEPHATHEGLSPNDILSIIREAGIPIAAPSANLSGRPSCTTAQDVLEDMDGRISGVVDGGPCAVGVESTILDLTCDPPRLLRPGGLPLEDLERLIGKIDVDKAVNGALAEGEKPKAPGMKYRHYAPKAPVTVITGAPEKSAQEILRRVGPTSGVICFEEFADLFREQEVHTLGPVGDKLVQAQRVFDALRAFDHTAVSAIWAQCPDSGGIGLAVTNRLNKAAGFHIVEA